MDSKQVGEYWNNIADFYMEKEDLYKELLNTPSFLKLLGDIDGKEILDIGCGDGINTYLLSKKAKKVVGIDIAERFIFHCRKTYQESNLEFLHSDVYDLEATNKFDIVTSFMSFMDIPDYNSLLLKCKDLLVEDGVLQFSVLHPCTSMPYKRLINNEDRRLKAMELGNYFSEVRQGYKYWKRDDGTIKTPIFYRQLQEWINTPIELGYELVEISEPVPTKEEVEKNPVLHFLTVLPIFLHIKLKKNVNKGKGT